MAQPDEKFMQQLAIDAFRVFGPNPKDWPNEVHINRSGYTDVNIRGIYTLEDRLEFFNVPLDQSAVFVSEDIAIHPESSGDPD